MFDEILNIKFYTHINISGKYYYVNPMSVCEITFITWADKLSGDNKVWQEISRFTRTLLVHLVANYWLSS